MAFGVKVNKDGGYTHLQVLTSGVSLTEDEAKEVAKQLTAKVKKLVGYRLRIVDIFGTDYVVLDTNDEELWEFSNKKPAPVSLGRAKALMALVKHYDEETGTTLANKIKLVKVVR